MQKIIQLIQLINQEVVLYQIIKVNQKDKRNKKINHIQKLSRIN